ncbi:MAG: amidohydrolase family protein [Clostridia bacterium]|nr:amidohydrolase family protein [Clostridia bacterium]
MKKFYQNGVIITDGKEIRDMGILTEDGKILDLIPSAPADAEIVELHGNYILPGLIELHCHGGDGAEFIDGTEESILRACRLHADHGTRVLYPTISATDYDTMVRALEALEACRDRMPLEIPGAHLEGPYLAPEMCGAQDTAVIRLPNPQEYEALVERFGSLIARWSYAPERDTDGKFLAFLKKKGITPATAHSSAEYSHMKEALAGGNRLVTHLYSCTSTITRHGGFRHLGVIESAFLMDDIYVETIADGCHLPPELLRMIVKIKGVDRVCLVTDAIRFGGLTAGEVGGSVPYVIEDGVAKLADRSAFAGSIATADMLIERTVRAGFSLPDTVRMMTETPATLMGLSTKGHIARGYDADFTVLDRDLKSVAVG